ncbi:E3 ubiquitin-protein ligase MARCHF2-like isoform X2 [Chelonus insularis]|uniref:E3 ubiquitin-protein ligase MARCHF2-like isoform X2 n=1 Tax=Chelonus insularis TaxID=460826 RepID=UPI00158ED031|nr:E3 ubiquitin-protein ligase MARCHF2-like isoform X2 [Chelonus insularis]
MSNVELPDHLENINNSQSYQTSTDELVVLLQNTQNEAEDSFKDLPVVPFRVDNNHDPCSRRNSDMCRICHMGGFPPVTIPQQIWEWSKQTTTTPRVDSQISNFSTYAYLGPLISACKCRGTVALIHVECLERWLTESGHSRCELCGHKYSTKRVPRHGIFQSIWIWFNTVIVTRQMILDVLYLVVTTPLALFSIYICALTVRIMLNSGFYEIPWIIIAMLPTCSLTLIAYWTWIITIGRYITRLHGRRWRRFWRNNFVVRLLPDDPSVRSEEVDTQSHSGNSTRILNEEEQVVEEQQEGIEYFL